MKKINTVHYSEKTKNGIREYARLRENGSFALSGAGEWVEKTCTWGGKFTLIPAPPEIAKKLETAFLQEQDNTAKSFAKLSFIVSKAIEALEKEHGQILYTPSPELLQEMGTMESDPGWETEKGMGITGKDV